jgi:hypothetical protein
MVIFSWAISGIDRLETTNKTTTEKYLIRKLLSI